jgi:hypothetical protein
MDEHAVDVNEDQWWRTAGKHVRTDARSVNSMDQLAANQRIGRLE